MSNTTETKLTGEHTSERQEILHDILVTAIEGGVNYWAEVQEYELDEATLTARAVLLDHADGGDPPLYEVNIETVERGLEAILSGKAGLRAEIVADLAERTKSYDVLDVDAGEADCIVQVGIFGAVEYA